MARRINDAARISVFLFAVLLLASCKAAPSSGVLHVDVRPPPVEGAEPQMFVEGVDESLENVRRQLTDASLKHYELEVRVRAPGELQWRYLEPVLLAGAEAGIVDVRIEVEGKLANKPEPILVGGGSRAIIEVKLYMKEGKIVAAIENDSPVDVGTGLLEGLGRRKAAIGTDPMLIISPDKSVPCRDLMTAYQAGIKDGLHDIAFAKAK